MANEAQYYSPIVQAMIASAENNRQKEQLKAQIEQHKTESALRQRALDQEEQRIKFQHEYEQNSMENANELRRIHQAEAQNEQIKNVRDHLMMGGSPALYQNPGDPNGIPQGTTVNAAGTGPLGQGARLPTTIQPGQTPPDMVNVPLVGNRPISVFPTAADQMAMLRAQAEAKQVNVATPAYMKKELGDDLPDRLPINVLDTYANLIGRKNVADQNNATKLGIADTQSEWRKYVADQNNTTKELIAALRPNPTSDKIATNNAIRGAFQKYGDWNKVKAAAAQGEFGPYSSDIFDHAEKVTKLPGTMQNKVDTAATSIDQVKNAIEAVKNFAAQHPDLIGSGYTHPIVGVKRLWEQKMGTEPDDIGNVDSALNSVAAMQPQQHGFRGTAALEEFKKSTGIDLRTNRYDSGDRAWLINPGKTIQALQSIANFNDKLKQNILNGGKGSSNTPQFKEGQIVQHKDGSKWKITRIDQDGNVHAIPIQ